MLGYYIHGNRHPDSAEQKRSVLICPEYTPVRKAASVPSVRHELVRQLSKPDHAASLASGLFRDPFQRVDASPIRTE
jgi:hypothetical protein